MLVVLTRLSDFFHGSNFLYTFQYNAINNNYKLSKNEPTTNEDKNKQIHSKIKIHNEHLKNITKIDKYEKKLNSTFMTEHKTEHNYTLVSQAINICKFNKEVTKEIKHISNSNTKAILQFLNSWQL